MVPKGSARQELKTEEKQLRDYELLLIISPEVVDEELEGRVDRIGQLITERGGEVSATEPWGRRKLAYPIEHFTEGHYVLIRFSFEPALCKELEASLRISEEIIRHLLINLGS
ncbi:MAG: 30S ribosomal protein S6 [Dehalococcoidia bacterium]|jgi:small subunit ribosomal protein S6